MNVFSSEPYLTSMLRSFPHLTGYEICDLSRNSGTYRIIARRGRAPSWLPLTDYFEPVSSIADPNLAPEFRTMCFESTWGEVMSGIDASTGLSGAPFIDLDHWVPKPGKTERNLRRLERELGTPSRIYECREPTIDLLDRSLDLILERDRRAGRRSIFGSRLVRKFIANLFLAKVATMQCLEVEKKLVSTHIGLVANGRSYWWLPAHAHFSNRVSPGHTLLLWHIEREKTDGKSELDFLLGMEDYKKRYTNESRMVINAQSQASGRVKSKLALRFCQYEGPKPS
jgi:hypothetical protein